MSHLARRIVSTEEVENGTMLVRFKNGVRVFIWKGEIVPTAQGPRYRLYIDGFRFSALDFDDTLIDFEIDGFVTYDMMLNILNIMSRR